MKYRTAVIVFFLTFIFAGSVDASPAKSFFNRKNMLSKKEMRMKIDSLTRSLDSLKRIIDGGAIEMVSGTEYDTLNVGGLDAFEYGDYNGYAFGSGCHSTDSLLHTWYQQRSLTFDYLEDPEGFDSTYFESNVPDSVYIERLKKMNSFIQLPYNNIVRNHIVYYTTRIPGKMSTVLGLCPYYMPIFEEILDKYDMPKELKVMAIIESALNPVAVSSARAKGIWQFMYSTARQYGLEITSYVDERLDPVKSAEAAARYLKDAYAIFGDWSLAIASYNCGAGNVNKAIRRSGSRDFWTLYPYLPRETRGYVPAFVAALYTLNYYKEHRIVPEKCNMPAHVDTFKINRLLHFDQISHVIGLPKDVIKSLNPQYLHDVIPGVEHTYILRIPYEYTGAFVDNQDSIFAYKDSVYFSPVNLDKIKNGVSTSAKRVVHVVKSGETLGGIALKYKVKVSDIQGWNRLRGTVIRKGQRLEIYPGGSYKGSSVSSHSSSGSSKVYHTVRSGETLGSIAMKYKVSVANLRSWNGIKGDMIRLGQKLVIYSKNAPAASSTQGGYVMYTVKSGDTLWEIAKKFEGVTVNDIMKLNGFTKNSKIYPGKKIKIRKA